MAAKSKKRLCKIENKLLKLDKLQLEDVICSICQSILIQPVTLPCYHDFCQFCFNGSVENNALCCPLCRLRIGSWLRKATKQKNVVNNQLWNFLKSKFPAEIEIKLKGGDLNIPDEKPIRSISIPGEIRSEYEAEVKRLQVERFELERKHLQETELLIKKIQEEEEEAHRKYLERLKQDEILAQRIQKSNFKNLNSTAPSTASRSNDVRNATTKSRLRATRIDSYLCKPTIPVDLKGSPELTDDNTSTDGSTPRTVTDQNTSLASPEMIPSYGKYLKNLIDKKLKNVSGLWNKENGEKIPKDIDSDIPVSKPKEGTVSLKCKSTKTVIQSLPVSLPYTGILQHKKNLLMNRTLETGSADSMRQELCFFKPINGATPTSFRTGAGLPVRVPSVRAAADDAPTTPVATPSRSQYLDSLCRLRDLSLTRNLPSAFVIALNMLRVKKGNSPKCEVLITKASKKMMPDSPTEKSTTASRRNNLKNKLPPINGITKLHPDNSLRRTRSMGSLSRLENETTPKKSKVKKRKAFSERKPYLRSAKKLFNSPSMLPKLTNNNKVNIVVKNSSSQLENGDVTEIIDEQLRIEKLIEQEKSDLELARRMDAELNGGRQRRAAVKRQNTLDHALRPTKKLKV